MKIPRDFLEKFLVDEWQYKPKQVVGIIDELLDMDDSILASFQKWVNEGVIPEKPEINGWNPKNIADTYPFKPPACFLMLDWIRREPEEAIEALKDEYGVLPENIASQSI